MGVVSELITGGTGLGQVASLAQDLVDRIFPDKIAQATQRAEYLQKAQELDNQIAQGQMAIDQAEAVNNSMFIAGWRPFIGWVCGSAFAYHFIALPILESIATAMGYKVVTPVFDMQELTTVLMGMLGLGSLRTVERLGDKGNLPWQKS